MSPIEKDIIRKKLTVIIENIKILENIMTMTLEEYSEDIYKRKATEKLIQELIEASIDINTHIIVKTNNPVPDNYFESFIELGRLKIISEELAEKLAPSAGLRNRLVHEYDDIKDSIILKTLKLIADIYPKYIKGIEDYLFVNDKT